MASLPAPGGPLSSNGSESRGLLPHGASQRLHRSTVANQRTVNPAASIFQKILRHPQLAFQRCGSLRDPHLERGIHLLQLVGGLAALFIEPSVVDRTGDMLGDDRDQRPLMFAERASDRRLDRKDSHQLITDQERDRELALRVLQTGNGHGVAKLGAAARLQHLLPLHRSIGTLLSQVGDVHHLAPFSDDADHSCSDSHAAADRLVFVAATRHDGQRVACWLQQQEVRVMELE